VPNDVSRAADQGKIRASSAGIFQWLIRSRKTGARAVRIGGDARKIGAMPNASPMTRYRGAILSETIVAVPRTQRR
jgi:hypothetical protein